MQLEPNKSIGLTEYNTTSVGVDLTQFHDFDLVEWHKQIGDIVSRRMIQSSMNIRKL
jgi:hypothetical protein